MAVPVGVEFEPVWQKLRGTFESVLSAEANMDLSAMAAIQSVYRLVSTTTNSDKLYDAVKELLENHVRIACQTVLSSNDAITTYLTQWNNYKSSVGYLNLLCIHMNDGIAKKKTGPPSDQKVVLEKLSHDAWKTCMIEDMNSTASNNKLMLQVLQQIDAYRNGMEIEPNALSDVVKSLITISSLGEKGEKSKSADKDKVYFTVFERSLLERTKQYYAAEAKRRLAENNMSQYLRRCDGLLTLEADLCKRIYYAKTQELVMAVAEDELIRNNTERIRDEAKQFLDSEAFEDFIRMFTLLRKVKSTQNLLDEFEEHITHTVKQKIESLNTKSPTYCTEFVDVLLETYETYTGVASSMAEDKEGQKECSASVGKAFRTTFISSIGSKAPEILAKYCDQILKKSKDAVSEDVASEKQDGVITLFQYLDGKDIFQKFFTQYLAKRLTYKTSISEDLEGAMISRLKLVCGIDYVSKMQRMFNDLRLNQEIAGAFKSFLSNLGKKQAPKFDFNVMILTAACWPFSQKGVVELPKELADALPQFEKFYAGKFQGRKISWLHHISQVDIKLVKFGKPYELSMLTYQAVILLCFNDGPQWTVDELLQRTGLTEPQLLRFIKPLKDMKLLMCKDEKWTKDSLFVLNTKFAMKSLKMKVNAGATDSSEEAVVVYTQVEEDRRIFLQLLIVRIMKTKKTIRHNQLIEEIIRGASSRFQPTVPNMKKCIEDLIRNEYMGRSEEHHDEYFYIA